MSKGKILVVDDEHLIRWSLTERLTSEGFEVVSSPTGEQALKEVAEDMPDLILLDVKLPGIDGMEVLERLRASNCDRPVIMITAHGLIPQTVKALKLGAFNYITKPFDLDELVVNVNNALELMTLRRDVNTFKGEESRKYSMATLIGESPKMRELVAILGKIIPSDTSILLQGETGSGKDHVAKTIHYSGQRKDKPFMEMNCATLPENLFESEMFGFEKGAFTDAKSQKKGLFELADGGTVYLDEIGDMPGFMQAKLLKLLEDKTFRRLGGTRDIHVDIRIIAATNKDLAQASENNTFRKDLYFRLNAHHVHLPPLRSRLDDLPLLVPHFVTLAATEFGKKQLSVPAELYTLLATYSFPGNIRELKAMIFDAVSRQQGAVLGLGSFAGNMGLSEAKTGKGKPDCEPSVCFGDELPSMKEVRCRLAEEALRRSGGNISIAARLIGLTRQSLSQFIRNNAASLSHPSPDGN